uniref:Sodium/nucleoside cotransporter 1-like n=1 Tax=Sinocyclocheilus grahami TaxID=75366 RepID=A0A672LG08_SINGR
SETFFTADKEDLQLTTLSYGNEQGVDNPAFVKVYRLEEVLYNSGSQPWSWRHPNTARFTFCKTHSKIIKYIALGILAAGYLAYFIAACYLNFQRAVALVVLTCLCVFIIVCELVNKFKGDSIRRLFKPVQRLIVVGLLVAWLAIDTRKRPEQLISFGGVCLFIIAIFLFSAHRTAVSWRTVFWGLGLQFAIGLFVIRTEPGLVAFEWLGKQVQIFLDYTKAGSSFVFGNLIDNIFAFQALPIVVFFSSVMSVLYYLGVMQWVITKISWVMQVTMGTSSTETLSVAGNIFVGQTEAPLLIRPYLKDMTKSEIHAVMTGGFATIAGSVMGAFISFGIDASSLISASVMAAPCALAISKLSYPETEKSKFTSKSQIKVDGGGEQNVLEAVSGGASASIGLVTNIAANLIAFLAILDFINATLRWLGGMVGFPDLICSYVFMPVAFMMGIPYEESFTVAELIGTKLFLNEFIAYEKLSVLKNNRLNGILEDGVDKNKSEIHAVMTGGFATIAGSVMGAFISFGVRQHVCITQSCVAFLVNVCVCITVQKSLGSVRLFIVFFLLCLV